MECKKIYLVASYTDTIPGRLIKFRTYLRYGNGYSGADYSHISLSTDSKLDEMMSFARKELDNPFNAGLIKEDIRDGMFALKQDISKIAVMELSITKEQYNKLSEILEYYWNTKEQYGYNFAGLITMLFCGKGATSKNNFFCSQWVATVLQESGIDVFNGEAPKDIKPIDVYEFLKNNIIYEGPVTKYPEYNTYTCKSDNAYSIA